MIYSGLFEFCVKAGQIANILAIPVMASDSIQKNHVITIHYFYEGPKVIPDI